MNVANKHISCIALIFLLKYTVVGTVLPKLHRAFSSVPSESQNLETTLKPDISPLISTHLIVQFNEYATIKELPFKASLDANILKKVIHGFGANETAIINILTKRTISQRQKIIQAFKSDYKKNLVEKLMHLTSGRFKDVLIALLTPKYEFLARTMNEAIRSVDSRKQMLIDILCSLRPNSEISEINLTYETLFKKSLESHIIKVTAGPLKKLLVTLNKGDRKEYENAVIETAIEHSQTLYQSGNSSTFIKILALESFPQINLLIEEYERRYSHSLFEAIEEHFSGNFKRGLLAIIKNAVNPAKYWAERLHESLISVSGPVDDDLIFILVTRAEIDLEKVKLEYRIMYHRSLAQHISENTHGDYKNTLLALLGKMEDTDVGTFMRDTDKHRTMII